MPAFGLSAVPLPTKIRRMLPGAQAPTADALGAAPCAAVPINGTAGSPLVVAAALFAIREVPPCSRRLTANAAHANGAAAGPSPLPPVASHARRLLPIPLTPPVAAAARGAEEITGAVAASGPLTTSMDEAGELAGPSSPFGVLGAASGRLSFGDTVLLLGRETSAVEGTATVERLREGTAIEVRLRFLLPEVDPLGALEPLLSRAAGESLFGVGDEFSVEADEASLGAADRVVRRDGALVEPDGD